MTKNTKNTSDISYSLKIGSSTYYVLSHRMNMPNYHNAHLVAEDAAIRSKSAKNSRKPSIRSKRSKSRRQSLSSEHRPMISNSRKVAADVNFYPKSKRQQPMSHQIYRSPYNRSTLKKIKDKSLKHDHERSNGQRYQDAARVTRRGRKKSIETTKNNQREEIIQLFNEQKYSFIQLLEQYVRTMITPSTDVIQQIVAETLKKQEQISTKELEQSLVQTIQQGLLKYSNQPQSDLPDANLLDQLQDILIRTIDKYVKKTNKNDNIALKHLFNEQKQVLIDTLQQQQSTSTLSIDLIKKVVNDVLSEQKSTNITTKTTTNTTSPCQLSINVINSEVKITANRNLTRVDAIFRQQRDTIVANRYLRDTVRKWSNVRSISSLIRKIQSFGTNDLENAWLVFYWIGQNISYDFHCDNHSNENVFQNRTGSCQGFVNLFHQCCSLLNIQCLKISGYIKQNFLRKSEDLKKLIHSWNAIVLDQYTYLVDPTRSADRCHNTNEFQDYYFLTSPEEFIYTHYSNGYQLLQPEITEQEFLSLPIIKSNYYRLNLSIVSPKQGFNQTNENIFKVSIKTPAYVDLFASLKVNHIEYPRHLHTLYQRDLIQTDTMNCFLAPPTDGQYEITIYAKTNDEVTYQDTIYMKLNVSNLTQAVTFPIVCPSFIEYKCILIEPFRCLLRENESILIRMKIPGADGVKIKNGENYVIPEIDEYKNGLLEKKIYVQGDLHVCAQWNDKADQILTICVFNMI